MYNPELLIYNNFENAYFVCEENFWKAIESDMKIKNYVVSLHKEELKSKWELWG